MTKYLPAINDYDEVKYDFLANKNSKFLFNLLNKYQENGKSSQLNILKCLLTITL